MRKASKRKCILVLGMHRSGTSALTRVLSLMGARLPQNLMPAVAGNNDLGFWEPIKIAEMNAHLLADAGSRWDDWRPLDLASLPKERYEHYVRELRALLESEYQDASLFVLKDPRISRFVTFYRSVLESMDVEPLYVISERNPLNVIASLAKRDEFTDVFSSLVWLRHVLEAEVATRGGLRVFVSYDEVLEGWGNSVERIERELKLEWPRAIEDAAAEVEANLSRGQRHHARTIDDLVRHPGIADQVKDAFVALKQLEEDPQHPAAMAMLDRIKAEIDTASRLFGAAFYPELRAREARAAAQVSQYAQRAHAFDSSQSRLSDAEDSIERLNDERTKALNEVKLAMAKEELSRNLHRRSQQQIDAMRRSTSWRVTAPLRGGKRALTEKGFANKMMFHASRNAYRALALKHAAGLPYVGPLLERLKYKIAGMEMPSPAASSRVQLLVPGGSSKSSSIAKSGTPTAPARTSPRVVQKTPLKEFLASESSQPIGDPPSAAIEHANLLISGAKAMPRVSVIVPTWNRKTSICDALDSALNQSLPPHEIIVSDDGSVDMTIETVERAYPRQIAQRIIKIVRNEHRGVSAARNAGLAAASGDLIAYLDSDNTWRKDFLLIMAAAFVEADHVNTAYSALLSNNKDTGHTMVRGREFDRASLLEGNFIDLNIFVHRRHVYDQLGGFDESLTRLVDWDLIVRYSKVNAPLFLPFMGADYNLEKRLNNITLSRPLNSNYQKVITKNRPERIQLGVEPLRLAYFVYDYPALSQTFVLSELRHLTLRGVDVIVYYAVDPDVSADVDFKIRSFKVGSASELAKLLVEHHRSICHSHFAYPGVTNFVRPACREAGVYYTFMPHAVDIFHEANRKRSQVGELGADQFCLKVFVYGDHHRRFLEEQGVPREKIAYTFQAVDLSPFELIAGESPTERFRDADEPFRVIAIGRFIEKKGFDVLIKSMARLPKDRVALDLYGYGPLDGALRDLATQVGASNVSFRGVVRGAEELSGLYRNADVLAVPCVEAKNGDIDGFPTVILEAMVAGVPVVATRISAIPDYVRDGIEGVLVNAGDAEALADAIWRIAEMSPPRRSAMVDRAKRLVQRMVGSEKTTQRLLDAWLGYEIDIVLVTFNTKKYDDKKETFEIIERIIKYTTTNYTLTIIDNDSDDEFWAEIVRRVAGRVTVRLIRNDNNIFCGPASNVAISQGQSEFIIYICSKEGFIKEHGWERVFIDRMRSDPSLGLAGHLVHLPSHVLGKELAAHPSFGRFRHQEFALNNPSRQFVHVQGGVKVLRRSMFDAVGGYNNATPQDHMDVELSYAFESCGYKIGQINEVASVTRKTLPGLEAILDEATVIAHPLDNDSAEHRLDALRRSDLKFCNVCGSRFHSFRVGQVRGEQIDECPECRSTPFERLMYRALANAPYTHRSGRCAILGAANTLSSILSSRMFASASCDTSVSGFIANLQRRGAFSCIAVDVGFLSEDSDELWCVIADKIEENGEILIAGILPDGGRAQSVLEKALKNRRLELSATVFDVASEKVGYDWRALLRLAVKKESALAT